VWRLVVVASNECTCLDCGETTHLDYCERCSKHETGEYLRNLVPTVSYLQADEYRLN